MNYKCLWLVAAANRQCVSQEWLMFCLRFVIIDWAVCVCLLSHSSISSWPIVTERRSVGIKNRPAFSWLNWNMIKLINKNVNLCQLFPVIFASAAVKAFCHENVGNLSRNFTFLHLKIWRFTRWKINMKMRLHSSFADKRRPHKSNQAAANVFALFALLFFMFYFGLLVFMVNLYIN